MPVFLNVRGPDTTGGRGVIASRRFLWEPQGRASG